MYLWDVDFAAPEFFELSLQVALLHAFADVAHEEMHRIYYYNLPAHLPAN